MVTNFLEKHSTTVNAHTHTHTHTHTRMYGVITYNTII